MKYLNITLTRRGVACLLLTAMISTISCHHHPEGGDIAKAQRTGQDTLPSGAYFVYNGSHIGVVDSNPKWFGIGFDSGVMTVAQKDTLYSSITIGTVITSRWVGIGVGSYNNFSWGDNHDSSKDIWEQPNRGLPVTYPKGDSVGYINIDSIEWVVWVKNDHLFMDASIHQIKRDILGHWWYEDPLVEFKGFPVSPIVWIFLKRKNTQTIIVNQNR